MTLGDLIDKEHQPQSGNDLSYVSQRQTVKFVGQVMGNLDYKQFSERHRPHIHPPGATLFVTYRLAGSIPQPVVRKYRAKKEWFETELRRTIKTTRDRNTPEVQEWLERAQRFHRVWFLKFEDALHQAKTGPMWMKDRRVAERVSESLRRLDGQSYTLDAYCVMSNHVHAVFTPFLAGSELKESFDELGHLIFVSDFPGLAQIMHSLKGRTS